MPSNFLQSPNFVMLFKLFGFDKRFFVWAIFLIFFFFTHKVICININFFFHNYKEQDPFSLAKFNQQPATICKLNFLNLDYINREVFPHKNTQAKGEKYIKKSKINSRHNSLFELSSLFTNSSNSLFYFYFFHLKKCCCL